MSDIFMADRRDALKALLAISAAGALAACKASTGADRMRAEMAAAEMNGSELALLSAMAQTIIPKTETAGAVEAGVPAVIADLFKMWGDDNYRAYWRGGLANLDAHFKKVGGQAFETLPTTKQVELLGAYDAKAYAEGGFDDFYKSMKSTIATAYYMSEPGATEELAYESVPGEWRGCVPLSEQPKTWAT